MTRTSAAGNEMQISDHSPAERIARIAALLEREFGTPDISAGGDPLDTLVGTILSQSTSGTNSHRAFLSLKAAFPRWEDAVAAGPGAIEGAIRSGGLAKQKSKRIHRLLSRIRDERGALSLNDICAWPDDQVFAWLTSFEGVGTKTVAAMLMFACGRDICPVDTHVARITRRLGLVPPRVAAEEIFQTLGNHVPASKGASLHINLIRFGRTRCTSRAPKCDDCPFHPQCNYYLERQNT